MSVTTRYSDQELELFKIRIVQKMEKANRDLSFLQEQIQDTVEVREGEGDWMDETSINAELEMLHSMANRQRKHIQDLENALIRIHNKSYGICVITGELIDKRRLMAVPTTTKSLAAKNGIASMEEEKKTPQPARTPKSTRRNVISKVIRKLPTHPVQVNLQNDDLLDEEDDLFEDPDFVEPEFDFDSLPAS